MAVNRFYCWVIYLWHSEVGDVGKRGSTADAALCAGRRRLRGNAICALVTDYYPSRVASTYLRHDHATGGIIPGACALTGSWILTHFAAGDFRHPVRDMLLMLPALRQNHRQKRVPKDRITHFRDTVTLSKTYRGNVLIYAACSASFLRG